MKEKKRSVVLSMAFFLIVGAVSLLLGVKIVGGAGAAILLGAICAQVPSFNWFYWKRIADIDSIEHIKQAKESLWLSCFRGVYFAFGAGICEAALFTNLKAGMQTSLVMVATSATIVVIAACWHSMEKEKRQQLAYGLGAGLFLTLATMIEQSKLINNPQAEGYSFFFLTLSLILVALFTPFKGWASLLRLQFYFALPATLVLCLYLGFTQESLAVATRGAFVLTAATIGSLIFWFFVAKPKKTN